MIYIFLIIFFLLVKSDDLFAQSVAGNALSLDGVDDYAWVPDDTALNPQNQITLEAWVFSEEYDKNQWQEFIMKGGNDPSFPRQYYIRP